MAGLKKNEHDVININSSEVLNSKLGEALLQAAQAAGKHYGEAGLISYLEAQALAAPSPFLALLGRLLAREEKSPSHKITHIEIVAPMLQGENNVVSTVSAGDKL